MQIYLEDEQDLMGHLFKACNTEQIREFVPEKRAFRIQGHSTTIRLERAFWNVLEAMCRAQGITLAALINQVYNRCLVANDKNLASCLRVICVKYMNVYG